MWDMCIAAQRTRALHRAARRSAQRSIKVFKPSAFRLAWFCATKCSTRNGELSMGPSLSAPPSPGPRQPLCQRVRAETLGYALARRPAPCIV